MARIVVCGYMVRHPVAGNILAYLHYVLGFERLGHEVLYLEESGWPYSSYDPATREWVDHPATGLGIVRDLFKALGMRAAVCFVNRETGATDGATRAEITRALTRADLLVNVGGVCWLPDFAQCPRRAFIDLDPLFTQVEKFGARILGDYHVHFTYGANIGTPVCPIPTAGVHWLPLPPPVVPDVWPSDVSQSSGRFTTVANWSGYGSLMFEGREYGQKDREFLKLLDLPSRTSQLLEIAISGASDDVRTTLTGAGWHLRAAGDSVGVSVASYRDYVTTSMGEFSAAKHAYVATRSGWFSDRSVCYLAAGRPVVLQDTGFSDWLPTGEGVLPFTSVDEAAAALAAVAANYARHSAAAAQIVRDYFSYAVVLPRLLERSLGASAVPHVPGSAS